MTDEQIAVLLEERDRYREALVRISNANSGHWGWVAHEALHPKTPVAAPLDGKQELPAPETQGDRNA